MKTPRTFESFVELANQIYNKKFDYSKSEWKGCTTPILIICPVHGEFWQTPRNHLRYDCYDCSHENHKKLVYGVGVNDMQYMDGTIPYIKWVKMLQRCYSTLYHEKKPSYINCDVCPEWHYLSNFKKWFDENYIEGHELDKDILVKGNKIYSPDTCCFIPPELNKLLTKREKDRGGYPIGVYKQRNLFISQMSKNGHRIILGRFSTPETAFFAYKKAKEQYVKELAEKYYKEDKITERVYRALLDYRVEITD